MSTDSDTSTDTNKCLRCGAPYEPGAIVCFTCGAPIGETETPTNPVPIIKLKPLAAMSEAKEEAAAAAASTAPAVASPRPTLTTATPGNATVNAPKRRRWPLVLALCLLLSVAVGGGLYVLRGVTAAPPVARQTVYQDPQHRFRVERPALWTVTPMAEGVTMSDSGGTSTAQISVLTPTAKQTAKSYADTLATQLGLVAAPAQDIGGEQWEQRSGQVTGADGAVRQVVVFVTLHNDLLYTIQFSSPIASYNGINNIVYQPLLASFAFA